MWIYHNSDWKVLNLLPKCWLEVNLILSSVIKAITNLHSLMKHVIYCSTFLLHCPLNELHRSHQDLNAFLLHRGLVIRSSAHPNQSVYSIGLEILHIKTRFLNVLSTWNRRDQRFVGIIWAFCTSINFPSCAFVGLCVMRNLRQS